MAWDKPESPEPQITPTSGLRDARSFKYAAASLYASAMAADKKLMEWQAQKELSAKFSIENDVTKHTADRGITSIFWGGPFGITIWASRHVQQSKHTVFEEESDFQVKNHQILDPEGKK